jgi:hypothetical protein
MDALSKRKSHREHLLGDSERNEHWIVFLGGRAVAILCPELGRVEITGWE